MNVSLRAPARWQAWVFGLVALIACCGAFVGLSSSGLWIDELFTVHLIHHDGGLGEVFRRALTDTHPPLYYFFLYEWTRMAGFSESSLRLPSAVFAVLAIVIFATGTRRILSPAAIAFACAVATLSAFWFDQSQNARSYALCMAFAAGLLSLALALRARVRARNDFPTAHWLGLSVLGLLASLTHAYLLLALGMVLLFLILSVSSWRLRVALVITGLVVLAFNVAYYKMMMHSSQQDMQNMWFGNDVGFFKNQFHEAIIRLMARQTIAVVALLILFGIQRRIVGEPYFVFDELDTRWATALACFVLIGVIVCGIGTSLLVAPSFSDRNLLTCAPFAWLLLGRLYDAVGPRGYSRSSTIIAVLIMLLVGSYLLLLRGRELPRTESWRTTAQYVEQLPGCSNQQIPVILPYRFGHSTAFFRALAEHDFFGYYLPKTAQTQAYLPAEFAERRLANGLPQLLASRAANADTGGCTLLAWGVHDLDETSALKIALDLARQPGVAPRRVVMQEFDTYERWRLVWRRNPEGYVYLAIPQAASGASVEPPPSLDIQLTNHDRATLGDRVVVDLLNTYAGPTRAPYSLDTYSIQRWAPQKPPREDFLSVHRLTCDPATTKADWDVWPDPADPGCSDRPLPTSAGRIDGRL
ncbi:glycosyltransferase family 39 protein [Dyella psychrodurans]|uniref:glycosyltransferase family 39 protein n=1 Tax=Dyella psychrodurans TaxID=1927960 RepID=UPI001314247F|nr:glycosyltransferase family 39 protein [Dyella psychrodurans]